MITLKFTPTGQVFILDQILMMTPGPNTATRTFQLLSNEPADVAYVGTRVSGTPLAWAGLGGIFYLTLRMKNGGTVNLPMSSSTAAATAINNIQTAIAAATLPNVALNLAANGAVS